MQMQRLKAYARSQSRAVGLLRLGVGLWLVGLAAYLCSQNAWLGLLLLAPAAFHFYLGGLALQHEESHGSP